MPKKKKQEPIVTMRLDNHTRLLVRESESLMDALRMNPYNLGSDISHAWQSLIRAKWAINHRAQVLLSKKS